MLLSWHTGWMRLMIRVSQRWRWMRLHIELYTFKIIPGEKNIFYVLLSRRPVVDGSTAASVIG
jgi:hypothetical protein